MGMKERVKQEITAAKQGEDTPIKLSAGLYMAFREHFRRHFRQETRVEYLRCGAMGQIKSDGRWLFVVKGQKGASPYPEGADILERIEAIKRGDIPPDDSI